MVTVVEDGQLLPLHLYGLREVPVEDKCGGFVAGGLVPVQEVRSVRRFQELGLVITHSGFNGMLDARYLRKKESSMNKIWETRTGSALTC